MLAALLCNQPYTVPSSGVYDHYKRRPNEKVIWQDDEIKAQEELTKFKERTEDEQKELVSEAIEAVKAADSQDEMVADAQDVVAELGTLDNLMCQVECLNVLLLVYFRLMFEKRRQEEEIAALLVLGML
jgi:hypothetical protein